jgi:ATP-dependent protease ClpP protease subunit
MSDIYFSGRIGQESLNLLKDKILSENSEEEIKIYISSGGGSLTAAIAFYEWIRIKEIQMTTIAVGNVSSAAIIIFLAGEKRLATAFSSFLIHPGGNYRYDLLRFIGKIIPLRRLKEDENFEEYNNFVSIKIMKERTNISEDLAKKSITKSFLFLNPEKAKELGLIHKII